MPEIMQRLKGDITLKQAEQQIESNKKINGFNNRAIGYSEGQDNS